MASTISLAAWSLGQVVHAAPPAQKSRWTIVPIPPLEARGGDIALDSSGSGSWLLDRGTLTYIGRIPEVIAGGWSNLVMTAINDRGWITGYGRKAGTPGDVSFVLMPK